ncbi:NERD domain-containing protein [Salipaludibacillus sp. CUR1]|uniref:NERD domain-containing protein n=1 Tax=Salipaludibacillus sp. CUR1 TaxID=2820003 RepID=UPI001E55A593|nr:NERD domain-containing protein [Salipaludibacillus sp. CUR1]MCE7791163.1 NERD domain-containing protein [Salipaludibacillus sp. CUR1]
MIIKPPSIPPKVLLLEAVLRRIAISHPKRQMLEETHGKRYWGFRGEQSLQYYLDFLLPRQPRIFYALRLPCNNHRFQIDLLIVFPQVAFLIEVKHWAGMLKIEPGSHVIQLIEDKKNVYSCPLDQANHQAFQLRQWLKTNGFSLPIDSLVVLSNQKASIENPRDLPPKIIRPPKLLNYLQTSLKKYENLSQIKLEQHQLSDLSIRLMEDHQDEIAPPLEYYGLSKYDIANGVVCPSCGCLPMSRLNRQWQCNSCHMTCKEAHVQALKDYVLLFGRYATNKQIRNFLQVDRYLAKRLMQKMNCQSSGIKKGVKYDLMSL